MALQKKHFPFGLERELGLWFLREKNPFWFLPFYGFGYLCSRKGEEKEGMRRKLGFEGFKKIKVWNFPIC